MSVQPVFYVGAPPFIPALHLQTIRPVTAGVANFIQEYLDKYHFKQAHIHTPLFCLDCTQEMFDDIRLRIHKKNIRFEDGFIGPVFDSNHFFREPITHRPRSGEYRTEFRVRLARHETDKKLLNERPCDDLYIISDQDYDELRLRLCPKIT
jgi:hypothetical protein